MSLLSQNHQLLINRDLLDPEELKSSFRKLPPDWYLKAGFAFRYRRYSKGIISVNKFDWLNHQPFYQSPEVNPYAGGIQRKFEALDDSIKGYLERGLLQYTFSFLPQEKYEVGVHQIRIVADDEHMGKPAPEGVHHDGSNYVAILCVSRSNVNGGTSLLLSSTGSDEIIFEGILMPGDILIFDDKKLAHYTTPVTPKFPGKITYRDVFIFTFNKFSA